MFHDQKIGIYKGIIQYLLDSTNYSLHRIANLSNSPIAHLQLIYHHNKFPKNGQVELNLLKLFILFIDMEIKGERKCKSYYPAEFYLGE
ncbi:hypothetical protein [Legionella brunensis]|uniref:Uncharacterized protein n=1 Tax=Legionella brunensis TaxID=29422 RepID=A0A0W0SFN7_9GAMM|nr:hypothetical protein [Legionella brunensis]KTC81701.1 hypothetical protein Lbru_2221 [Legionella brunensis]